MKPRWFLLFVVVLFSLTLTSIATAQAPLPDGGNRTNVSNKGGVTFSPVLPHAPTANPSPSHAFSDSLIAPNSQSPAVLGQPGLSFGYVRTFGETSVAYLADNIHLNFPYGITADGNNVWIV